MARICRIWFALFLVVAVKADGASVSVLFVGNSLTQANDLPTAFKHFAAESSLHVDVAVRSITPGGAFFYDHWKRGQAPALFREQRPNCLVLQGPTIEPLFPPQNFN